ncbi:class I SAM-dependent methyltransferase [Cellulophaga baltica]|uniref:class I SAM-dependent methyltransferase n=1 Tax=Cellulophaga TaxID=104264 RepID=UPI001C06B891|nr:MULTISPECIES: class I SAM-dependent methyltransferase [Cellulophaga]MBU2995436.1 class I SAM-dependent methyltransferase [Cellulophaga baltica]MDO6766830.1 class I SAM-dependent methyltransferase [Cellulophaga sp. 1_MG-2023]
MSKKKRWSTKAVMHQIYENNMWGGKENDFYSGDGSHDNKIVEPYINVMIQFFQSFRKPISVCDLGCGDFNVGEKLVAHTSSYIAVDVVDSLIERNKEKFKWDNLAFKCLDICMNELPIADCAIVRQVMQHLSNNEILELVKQFKKYKYLIVTEHIPNAEFKPNIDIVTGQGIRLKKKSGVLLTEEPFNLKTVSEARVLEIEHDDKSLIVTTLYVMF